MRGARSATLLCILLALPEPAGAQTPPSLQDLSATREHPLFSPNRRPPPPPQPTVVAAPTPLVAAPPPPPRLVLSGVILGDQANLALLKHQTDRKPTAFTIGQYLDGWMLARIESRRVMFIRDEREVWVEMLERAH
jgi:type II secretory pathway component PulC